MMEPRTCPHVVSVITDPRRFDTTAAQGHARNVILMDTVRMTEMRDRRWHLVRFVDSGVGLVFGLDVDPREVRDLRDDPAHAARRRDMVEEMLHWRTLTTITPAPLPASAR